MAPSPQPLGERRERPRAARTERHGNRFPGGPVSPKNEPGGPPGPPGIVRKNRAYGLFASAGASSASSSPSAEFASAAGSELPVAALAVFAWRGAPPLERPADPTDAGYIPRPEWYFLGLFQLLKYFPGRWEVVGAIVLPTLLGAVLALLPWIDRSPSRDPRRRPLVMIGVVAGCLAIVALTALGWRDRPVSASARETWSLREIGGRGIAASAGCARC